MCGKTIFFMFYKKDVLEDMFKVEINKAFEIF